MIRGGPRALGCQATCQANILRGKEIWQEATGGKTGISSGKAVTAEAQGLCREASLSLRCPAALPPGNNKPLRNSHREFPLSSALLWDQQLDPSLLFSLNAVLNHMPSSSQSSFTPVWGKMLFPHLSPVCQLKCQRKQPLARFSWNKPSHF